VIVVVAVRVLPVRDYLRSLLEWAESLGVAGPLVVVGIYVFACVLLLPGSILTIGAGFLFNVVIGTITVSVGSTLGACAAFLLARTVARRWVARKVSDNAKFAAVDEAVGTQGWKIVLLTRLSPVFPFVWLNYMFGLTRVSFWSYAVASWIGMLPGTLMYVYFGSAARKLADAAAREAAGGLAEVTAGGYAGGAAERIFFWVGLVAAVAVAVFVTRVAKRAIDRAVEVSGTAPRASDDAV